MNEWKEVKLGEFAEINPRESIAKGTIAKKVPMEAVESFTKKIASYSSEEYKGGVKFKNGDTLIARITPSLENGKTAFVDILDDEEVGFGSTEFIVLREIKDLSDKHYLYYLAISPELREIAIQSMTGTSGRQRVQTNVVVDYEFPFPPLPEQKAIAEVLSSLDDKIDLLHRQNETLEEMAQTLFRQWFVEEVDEDWEEGFISDLAKHHKKSIRPQQNLDTIYHHYSIPSFDNNKTPVVEMGAEIMSNKYEIPENCIMFSKLNPHKDKRLWLIQSHKKSNSIASTEFQIVLPKKEKFLFFIYGWLNENLNYREIASGVGGTSSSHQRISPSIIFDFPCPIITDLIIEKYNEKVQPAFEKIDNNQQQLKTLEKLRDTLLPKLMNGEIRVNL